MMMIIYGPGQRSHRQLWSMTGRRMACITPASSLLSTSSRTGLRQRHLHLLKTDTTTRAAMAPRHSVVRCMSSSNVSPLSSSDADIEQLIRSHTVVLFSKTYCPFCKQAQALFDGLLKQSEKTTTIVNLDKLENGTQIQNSLKAMYGQSTVPYVFVNQTLIGGNSDAQQLARSGKLQEMLDLD